MEDKIQMKVVARMESQFVSKFGIPRQSGLVEELRSTVVFEPEFRSPDALRGLEGFSHLWLIWGFSANRRETWSPTVRPPRLGGNRRLGVFATRSPFRPNPLGLSCVKLEGVELSTPKGPVLHVSGADLMDGTPIYDIKPYVPYADCRPEAREGFAPAPEGRLRVEISPEMEGRIPPEQREALQGVLSWDPRPHYQNDPQRVYGMSFAGMEVKFIVAGEVLTVVEVTEGPGAGGF
ncbi:MAG: tRNA (N6-threonylcarbamoyladenosine(37)-N6)-methyltransferase TrmO [Oscillospiraceae bacterium]|jgi:tRNA-Thr(GGU) m(6)t(6)A37 methyltransferase TsaA|nr:tRNA (N6-threonylcarbamoyladenosine(37)-N6)-methyltransferase TrmO [Oscillospiraceae bacterium]